MPAPINEKIEGTNSFHYKDSVTGSTVPKLGPIDKAHWITLTDAMSIANELGQDLVTIHNAKFAIVALVRALRDLGVED